MALHIQHEVGFHSSDRELEKGFERIKHQALQWVFEGYPVGDYYEAALPGRDAFCMRDASHQAVGAEVLGLSRCNKNMFLKFAQGIAPERDYCSFWEIDRWNRPCPVDYTDDSDFWYNLPANFDVLHACWRLYLWTGDKDYLCHPDFDNFYALTVENYVKTWDHDNDGIPDTAHRNMEEKPDRRGVAGYDESGFARGAIVTAADTTAALGRAYLSYAGICGELGRKEQEEIYRKRGEAVFDRLDTEFYTEEAAYAAGLGKDRQLLYNRDEKQEVYVTPAASLFYWDAIRDLRRIPRLLDIYAKQMPLAHIEGLSHYPELQWRYGRHDEALLSLRSLMNPALPRKEYPEASFCAIGAMATGLMGLRPNAKRCFTGATSGASAQSTPGLAGVSWAEMNRVPILGRVVSILHEGDSSTTFTVNEGQDMVWRCCFQGAGTIQVPLKDAETQQGIDEFSGLPCIYADITVKSGESVTAVRI
jgi:hypothetical protein